MKYSDLFVTALSNLLRNKVRTALTVLAIFIGAFTLTVTNGLGSGISSYITTQVDNLGENNVVIITSAASAAAASAAESNTPQKYVPGEELSSARVRGPGAASVYLTDKDVDVLKKDVDLTNVAPVLSVDPSYIEGSNGEKYDISESNVGGGAHVTLASGKLLDNSSSSYQLLLPNDYPSVLGYSSASDADGKTVTIGIQDATGAIHEVTATVTGVQQVGLIGSSGALFNTALTTELFNEQSLGLPAHSKDKYSAITATMLGNLTTKRVNLIKSNLTSLGYSGETVSDELGSFQDAISAIIDVLDAFAIITLLAASFGIINTLYMSVQERTKEIGLMKAMGMRSTRIFILFSTEAVWMGFWGSFIGVVIAELLGGLANRIASRSVLKDLPGFSLLSFPIKSVVIIMLLIMVLAFLAGTLPARRAAKQNPIEALRYE